MKIIKNLIVVLIIIFLTYSGSIIYKRYFTKKTIINLEKNSTNEERDLEKIKDRPPLNTKIEENKTDENSSEKQEVANTENEQRESKYEISLTDCKIECKNYEKELDKFNYCQQVCGLSSNSNNAQNSTEENINNANSENKKTCDDLNNLEKDYCWRDLAIKEKDFEKCKKIEDKNIFNQCKNRITEDMLDSQSQKNFY